MRERLNNDPKVQAAVLGVAGIILVFFLFTKVFAGGGSTESSSTTTTPGATGTADATATGTSTTPAPATGTVTPSTGTATPSTGTATPSAGATGTAVTPSTGTATPPPTAGGSEALLPTKGLPTDVLVAYAKNKVILLLVVDPKSSGARRLQRYADNLKLKQDVEVFVTDTKQLPKYSRIAEGVNVTQTPAIVVIRPRKLTGSAPTATVSYGMRNERSFDQTVYDALYKGGQVPAYP